MLNCSLERSRNIASKNETRQKSRVETGQRCVIQDRSDLSRQTVSPEGSRSAAKNRRVFEALIWFARMGCPWNEMPKNFPPRSTCRRRLIEWEEQGIFVAVHQHLFALLDGMQFILIRPNTLSTKHLLFVVRCRKRSV